MQLLGRNAETRFVEVVLQLPGDLMQLLGRKEVEVGCQIPIS